MTELTKVGATKNAGTMTSLELLEQINLFREQEGNQKPMRHDNLLAIIRDEFEEEINALKIQETPYRHTQNGQSYPMFTLTLDQSKQVLVRESKFVRKAVITYIDKLENHALAVEARVVQALSAKVEVMQQTLNRMESMMLGGVKKKSAKAISASSAAYEQTVRAYMDNKGYGVCSNVLDSRVGISAKSLYADFLLNDDSHVEVSITRFGRLLSAMGYVKERRNHGYMYYFK